MPRTVASDLAATLIGQEIRRARRAVGLTQAELSERLDATASYISNMEAGRMNLTLGQLARVADAIGCDLNFALTPLEIEPASIVLPSS